MLIEFIVNIYIYHKLSKNNIMGDRIVKSGGGSVANLVRLLLYLRSRSHTPNFRNEERQKIQKHYERSHAIVRETYDAGRGNTST